MRSIGMYKGRGMGKRSDFKRIKKDFYPTPYEAVVPLFQHLSTNKTYHEPCAGNGALINHLEDHYFTVKGKGDIEPQRNDIYRIDAMDLNKCCGDAFVTNPPYQWDVLEPILEHLCKLAPAWLLLPADMMHNKRMLKHMKHCVTIQSIGRVKWFDNKSGMENSAWYLFDKKHKDLTRFYGRVES